MHVFTVLQSVAIIGDPNESGLQRVTQNWFQRTIDGEMVGAWFAMIAVREMGHDELLINSLKRFSYRAVPA